MASNIPFRAPLPVAPVYPDFHSCFHVKGSELVYADCARAASRLPTGVEKIEYTVGNGQTAYTLPMSIVVGEWE